MKNETNNSEKKPALNGPRYWRSLNEFSDKPEFKEWLHREFPEGASEVEGVNRRHFMKIMAASFAVAGVGAVGCRRPEQYILPYSKQPENSIPGVPVYFTSSFPSGKDSLPLIVETHQNRPTHIEGNPGFSAYGGSVSTIAQASVLNLYDPDRLTASYKGTKKLSSSAVKDLLTSISEKYGKTQGQGLAVLAEPSTSPSRLRLKKKLQKLLPRMQWAEYAAGDQSNPEKGAKNLFGKALRPVYNLKGADRIVSLDADFLGSEPGHLKMARDFAAGRKVANKADAKKMNRLYSVEAEMSLSGGMADHRLRLSASEVAAFAARLTAEVMRLVGADSGLQSYLSKKSAALDVDAKWVEACAEDLVNHGKSSVVIAGSHLSVEVQQLVAYINELIGANGNTLNWVELPADESLEITELAKEIKEGAVETLLILGGNPVYNAPADLGWKNLQKSITEVIRYGYYFDETALDSTYNIAATHFLESWSDGRTLDGTYVPVQPMIYPLFDGFQELEVLSALGGDSLSDPYGIVMKTFQEEIMLNGSAKDFERLLSEGYLPESSFSTTKPFVSTATLKNALSGSVFEFKKLSASNLELRVSLDSSVGDGFYNNNGWLQECPDPITKLTWDNAILISPRLAEELGFDTKSGEFLIGGVSSKEANFKRGREVAPLAKVSFNGVSVTAPVHIQPGQADWTIVLPLGYGRGKTGKVGTGTGFNAYPFTQSSGSHALVGASIELTGDTYNLANTQEHWSMEGRAIIRENTTKKHYADPDWVNKIGMESHSPAIYGKDKNMSLQEKSLTTPRGGSAYETPDFGAPPPNVDVWNEEGAREKFIAEQQWGMSIDLNTCIGCNACVVACQSENNIPIVGKEQIMRGREMHWIRLDRYYSSGDLDHNMHSLPSDPQVSMMPVGCLHCEMAPCEQVCPVNATVHDRQGLNVMAYNRCVGTRYCANNCPYKVRRFNFFDYNKRNVDELYAGPVGTNKYKTEGAVLASMQKNPDVTVRMRGVMEKCTYCVQRIEQGKIAQRIKAGATNDIKVPDGVIRTACQNACPTEAIVFGDISDENTAVSKAKANDRDYSLLGYLNTRPRTTYLARLRNPNPAMPDYDRISKALSYQEYKNSQPGAGDYKKEASHGDSTSH